MGDRDTFDCTAQQYHAGLDKLWEAMPEYKAVEDVEKDDYADDVFSLAAKTIQKLRAMCVQEAMGRESTDNSNVKLHDKIERLQAVIDKFPKTKDGVTVVPGMVLYLRSNRGLEELKIDRRYMGDTDFCWYSTKEAAEAAGGE
jgi:hypothetical protein